MHSVEEMMEFIESTAKCRATLGYDIDGVVFKVNAQTTRLRRGTPGARRAGRLLTSSAPSRR